MYQKYPTNMINYVDSKGNVVIDAIIRSIQVRSEDDIENNVIKNPAPGDRAYLPDESKVWIFGADGEWHQKATSGGGGSSNGGSSGGGLVVHCVDGRLDKTWQEIYDAIASGKNCVAKIDSPFSVVKIVGSVYYTDQLNHPFVVESSNLMFFTDSADGYPQLPPQEDPGENPNPK